MKHFYKSNLIPGIHKDILGKDIDKIITIDQSPIGRTPRSNPALILEHSLRLGTLCEN